MRRRWLLVPLCAALTGCGVFGGDDAVGTTVPTSVVTPVSTTTSTVAPVVSTVSADVVFAALGSRDPAALADAVAMVTPGSPAAVLVAHQLTVATLRAEVPEVTTTTSTTTSTTLAPSAPSSSLVDTTVPISTTTVSTAMVSIEPVRFSDPVFDDDGLLRSFSVEGASIDVSVLEAGPVTVVDDVQGRVSSVYRTATGQLSMLIDVTAGAEALEVFAFAAVHRPRTITSGSSGLVETSGAWGDPSVAAGESTRLLLVFDDASLDGEVLVTVVTQSGVDLGLVLPLIAP